MPRAGARPRVALASYPRSGNSWLRYMIELATGETSGSVYQDRFLPRPRSGIVIKTHKLDTQAYDAAIHLVRHPLFTLESYFHWRVQIGGEPDLSVREYAAPAAREWRQHTAHWRATSTPTMLVRFEDLRREPLAWLRRILAWLGYELPEARLQAAVAGASMAAMQRLDAEIGSRFVRSGRIGGDVTLFDPIERASVIAHCAPFLEMLDYDVQRPPILLLGADPALCDRVGRVLGAHPDVAAIPPLAPGAAVSSTGAYDIAAETQGRGALIGRRRLLLSCATAADRALATACRHPETGIVLVQPAPGSERASRDADARMARRLDASATAFVHWPGDDSTTWPALAERLGLRMDAMARRALAAAAARETAEPASSYAQ